jgi:type I restriction enzyme S subunit
MVKAGYKQTEVGIIPEDWDVKKLGDLGSLVRGGSPRPAGDPRYFKGDFIPWLTVAALTNISEYQLTVYETVGFLTEAGSTFSRILPAETLIIANSGATLGVAKLLGMTCCANDGIAAIINQVLGDKSFVCFFINTQTKNLREVIATGNDQPNLNTKLLREISIPFPSLPEQTAIATVLSDVDALIASLNAQIAKKRDIKTATMQQLLTGKQRLARFEGDWEMKTLFDIAERKKELFDDGDWIESEHITTEGVRLIQTGNIGIGCFIEKDVKKFIYEKSFISLRCKQLRTGDLLVCRLAEPAGRACVLPDIGDERIVTSVDVTIFRPPCELVDRVFLANVFSTPEWFQAVSDQSGGTTHKRISRGALGGITINLPCLEEQGAIAGVLSAMDEDIAALEQRLAKTKAMKQGMMQELLTGRTRLV